MIHADDAELFERLGERLGEWGRLIHVDDAELFERLGEWGRNQLGHACQLVAMWLVGVNGDAVRMDDGSAGKIAQGNCGGGRD